MLKVVKKLMRANIDLQGVRDRFVCCVHVLLCVRD